MTATTCYSYLDSPLGRLCVLGDDEFVTGLYLPDHKGWRGPDPSWRRDDAPFTKVRGQLAEFFAGERRAFDVPIRVAGTPFQRLVWQALVAIPFGETIAYAELARRVGRPAASRAAGAANGRNPISILVPCHRVIGADGNLSGYAGGVERKRWLLDWEFRRLSSRVGRYDEPDHISGGLFGARSLEPKSSGSSACADLNGDAAIQARDSTRFPSGLGEPVMRPGVWLQAGKNAHASAS